MTVTTVIRGNVVAFAVTFADVQGVPVTPASVVLHLQVLQSGVNVAYPMSDSGGGTFTYNWDTNGVYAPAIVNWSVRAESPDAADDGSFELTANWANPVSPP